MGLQVEAKFEVNVSKMIVHRTRLHENSDIAYDENVFEFSIYFTWTDDSSLCDGVPGIVPLKVVPHEHMSQQDTRSVVRLCVCCPLFM